MRRRFNKPYFLFRPRQALRRVRLALGDAPGVELDEVMLPWGLPLRYRRHEQTGLGIARRGLFDLTVSETLYRLTDSGDTAVDVGANIGHMTSVLATRVGEEGRVLAFEPHPEIREQLRANVGRWLEEPRVGRIEIREEALSEHSGTARLLMKPAFNWNQGSASLERQPGPSRDLVEQAVHVERLDDVLGSGAVGVMKLDVEGHERSVLLGAGNLLHNRAIRDIVFEDFDDPPTAAAALLKEHGYTVFSLDQKLLGPVLRPDSVRAARDSGDDPSYLATIEPARALSRLRRRGWAALGMVSVRR